MLVHVGIAGLQPTKADLSQCRSPADKTFLGLRCGDIFDPFRVVIKLNAPVHETWYGPLFICLITRASMWNEPTYCLRTPSNMVFDASSLVLDTLMALSPTGLQSL